MRSKIHGWRSIVASLAAVIALGAVAASPALAITRGTLDGNGHPFVGLMVAKNASGVPLWRCSGTLMSSTIYLTAGHCTEAPAAHVEIWFDSGPNFLGRSHVVAGTTSFGLNQTCAGTGGVYRIDKADDLNWLATFGLTS